MTAIDKTSNARPISNKRRSWLADLFTRLIKEKKLGTVGAVIFLVIVILSILAPWITPYDVNEINLTDRLLPPYGKHILGTDNQGRDLFTRILYGGRISMIVGLAAPTINALVSLVIGISSGFVGGKFDIIIQRFVDSWMAFPSLIIYLTIMSILGGGLFQIVLVLGVSGGITSSRTVRSAVMSIRENTYVEGAKAIGCSIPALLVRHILPNIMPMVIILFSMHIATAILAEATLSFLGFGIPPPNPTWGGMLSGAGRRYMEAAPWMALWPGLFLSVVVYSASMLGDAIRDILDPRLKGGLGRYATRLVGKKLVAKSRIIGK